MIHTCINTATTCTLEGPPPCKACHEEFQAKRCTHAGKPCPCFHCYPRTVQTAWGIW